VSRAGANPPTRAELNRVEAAAEEAEVTTI
jgi:fructokinase